MRLNGTRKTYGGVVAVDRVDLDIAEDEFFTLLGPSGSGKTTCLRMIAGFERPDEGSVELAGRDVTGVVPFTEDHEEWTGTTIRFEVSPTTDGTQVRFTHEGLVPQAECYGVCRVAWGEYILGSLKDLIASSAGRPDSFGSPEKLAEAQERARA